ncbi:hypothetical protein BDV12DRAFT_165531 [Aspergillus spectabilis]
MSDALCGPSNALQNFQKHTAVDRTLQQDRLISRQSPSQGFRSQNPNEGTLDPEFAAFESNSLVGAPLTNAQHGGHFVNPAPHMPMSHAAEAPNWATDFRNLQISGPPRPIHHQPGPSVAPVSAASRRSWHDEFLRQQQHATAQQNQSFGQGFQPSFAPSYGLHSSQMGTYTPAQETTADKTSAIEAFDESAFEAAFEQAKADMASQFEDTVVEANESETRLDNMELTEEASAQHTVPGTIRIGSDTILQTNKEGPQSAVNDADELARTAGQLLNSVSNETNQKFRESNFLALMRRIRDREVQVEGDEFRETAQSLHPGGKYYPEGKQQQNDKEMRLWSPVSQSDYVHVASNDNSIISESLRSHATSDAIQSTSGTEPNANSGPVDHDSLFASWNHGDRWA